MDELRKGKLGRITDNGLGYLEDVQSGMTYGFTFDKFPEYRGESVKQLGVEKGLEVEFRLDHEGRVTYVSRPAPVTKSMFQSIRKLFGLA